MTKAAFLTRSTLNALGQYYDAITVPDDFPEVQSPFTSMPLPADADTKTYRFIFEQRAWVDYSDDAAAQRDLAIQQKLADTEQQLTDANGKIKSMQTTIDAQADTIDTLKATIQQTGDAVVELAQATLAPAEGSAA